MKLRTALFALAIFSIIAIAQSQPGRLAAASGDMQQVFGTDNDTQILEVRYAFEKCRFDQARAILDALETCASQNGVTLDMSQQKGTIDQYDKALLDAVNKGDAQAFNSNVLQSRQALKQAMGDLPSLTESLFSVGKGDGALNKGAEALGVSDAIANKRSAIISCIKAKRQNALQELKTCRQAAIEKEKEFVVGRNKQPLEKEKEIIALYKQKGMDTSKLEQLNSESYGFISDMEKAFDDKKPLILRNK